MDRPMCYTLQMEQYAARFSAATELDYPVTSEGLIKHFNKFGLDNHHTGRKGTAEVYKNYKGLREDAFVKVARSYMGVETYVQILDLIGYGHMEEQGREDWLGMRADG